MLTGPASFKDFSMASDLPLVAVGVLCVVRVAAVAAGVPCAPGVVAVPLISDPVSEVSCVVVTVPALLVTTVGAGSVETVCGP